jgi:hypothetical protein
MTRLDQALTIRDAVLQRYRGPRFTPSRAVRVFLPGFECQLHYYPGQLGGLPFTLQIWPVSEGPHPLRPGRKVLHNKLLHLAWGDVGRAELISLRKPREWVDTLLARLQDDTGVVYFAEDSTSPSG